MNNKGISLIWGIIIIAIIIFSIGTYFVLTSENIEYKDVEGYITEKYLFYDSTNDKIVFFFIIDNIKQIQVPLEVYFQYFQGDYYT